MSTMKNLSAAFALCLTPQKRIHVDHVQDMPTNGTRKDTSDLASRHTQAVVSMNRIDLFANGLAAVE